STRESWRCQASGATASAWKSGSRYGPISGRQALSRPGEVLAIMRFLLTPECGTLVPTETTETIRTTGGTPTTQGATSRLHAAGARGVAWKPSLTSPFTIAL